MIDTAQAAAHNAVYRAVNSGALTVMPCARCGLEPKVINGKQRIQAHHPRGYDEAHRLDVEWLCTADYAGVHRASDEPTRPILSPDLRAVEGDNPQEWEISVKDFRYRLADCVRLAEKGSSFRVTRYGKMTDVVLAKIIDRDGDDEPDEVSS